MKNRTILTLLAVLCIGSTILAQKIDCSELPQKGLHPNAVNDFAKILNGNEAADLEQNLREYWDSTSIGIAVITVETMGNYDQFDYSLSLFNCWGLGAKDNRGVLLFISRDEKKISIRTGKGIEPFLTDGQAGEIIRGMGPYFRDKDYDGGVEYAVTAMITKFGTISWEDRMQAKQDRESAERRDSQEAKDRLIEFILGFALLALLAYIVYLIHKGMKQRKYKKDLLEAIKKAEGELKKGYALVKTAASNNFNNEAEWVKKESAGHSAVCNQTLGQADTLLAEARKLIDSDDPTYAERGIRESNMLIEKAFGSFIKLNEGLKRRVEELKIEAPKRLAQATATVQKTKAALSEYVKQGYRFEKYVDENSVMEKILADYAGKITDKEFHSEIYTNTQITEGKSKELLARVAEVIRGKAFVDRHLIELIRKALELIKDEEKSVSLLQEYKQVYPRPVWNEDDVDLKKAAGVLVPEKLEAMRKEIGDLNSMETQKFHTATIKFMELDTQINTISQAFIHIAMIKEDQSKSKSMFAQYNGDIKQAVDAALQKVKDSDVSGTTRSLAKEASQKLSNLQIETMKAIVDWTGSIKTLKEIGKLAESATRRAADDIETAAEERREAARRKKRREDEEEQSRRSSSYSSSSFSSYSSSNSSSFGGFSGGSSGGGGSDGGW